ncbi:MAG: hypothetical protein GXP31_08275 [Kiritimatiellaeota bacterium]|nr:hypothetical protein [Kiritimatiellota bacterium]
MLKAMAIERALIAALFALAATRSAAVVGRSRVWLRAAGDGYTGSNRL